MGIARELILSIVSGLVVAFVLEAMRGRRGEEPGAARASSGGGVGSALIRVLLALLGGVGIAFIAARLLRAEGFRFGLQSAEMAGLTIAGTLVCWILLSLAMRR